jgi:hypothetical protein
MIGESPGRDGPPGRPFCYRADRGAPGGRALPTL